MLLWLRLKLYIRIRDESRNPGCQCTEQEMVETSEKLLENKALFHIYIKNHFSRQNPLIELSNQEGVMR